MHEIWKSIFGYDGLYEVSNLGNIRSLPRKTTKGKILKPAPDKDGYYKVSLSKNNIKKNFYIHRVVAIAFLGIPQNSEPLINHKDENKQNNSVTNLEWCTPKYNTNYNGLSKRREEYRKKPIAQYTLKMEFVKIWSCRGEAEKELKTSAGNITSCCLGKRKTALGFIWKYV